MVALFNTMQSRTNSVNEKRGKNVKKEKGWKYGWVGIKSW